MKYHLQWLIKKHEEGEKIKYLFFWGHQPKNDGSIGESCLSQWWDNASFVVEGITYKTAEHWMMAEKARIFHDVEALNAILECNTPAEAKKLGRKVQNFDAVIWDEKKFTSITQGNIYKSSQHSNLKEFLLNTGDRVLVEASPVDNIWGIGMAKKDPNIENPTL
ncbi:MAG: NADAR family protein [Thermoflexibacter sp.]|jgi:hypothetical protein|nr:NADAR family protein [Thermoflexibacter sp.]